MRHFISGFWIFFGVLAAFLTLLGVGLGAAMLLLQGIV